MKCIILAALLLSWSAYGFEVEKADGSTWAITGETETITVAGQQYTLWHVPIGQGEMEVFSAIPDKYKGAMVKVSGGEPLADGEAIKVLEVHYKHSAIDFDSLKVRDVTPQGVRYVVYCAEGYGCNHVFRGGSWIELEENGKNRMGGMTGFERQTYLITKISAGAPAPPALTAEQINGRASRATAEDLRKMLTAGVTTQSSYSADEILTAARAVLEADGFSVAANDPSGLLFTDVRELKLTAKQADCGKKWGIGYIGDKRTETTVLLAVSGHDGQLTVRSAVGGILRINVPFGAGAADLTLTCNSTGTIEQDVAAKVIARLQQKPV